MDLVGDPSGQLDPHHLDSPRQRIEFRSHEQVEGSSYQLMSLSANLPAILEMGPPGYSLGIRTTRPLCVSPPIFPLALVC